MDVPERAPSLWASLNFTNNSFSLRLTSRISRFLRAFARPSLFTAQFRSRYGYATDRGAGEGWDGDGQARVSGASGGDESGAPLWVRRLDRSRAVCGSNHQRVFLYYVYFSLYALRDIDLSRLKIFRFMCFKAGFKAVFHKSI